MKYLTALISKQKKLTCRKPPFALFAACILAFTSSACSEQQTIAEVEHPYHHAVVVATLNKTDHYVVSRKFAGRVVSKQQASLNFEVSGRVASIAVDDGDKVAAGQLLASLDNKLLHIEYKQLQAQLQQVKAESELNQANINRISKLLAEGYASEQNIDELAAQQKVLQANEQQLNATIEAKQYQIDRSKIYAPFAGTVNQRLINMGEVVSPSQVAFELNQDQSMEVKVGVPIHMAQQLLQLQQQQQKKFTLKIDTKTIEVDNVNINSDINQMSRTVQARFTIPPNTIAYNNQLAYLVLEQQYQQDGYWVPLSALTDGVRGTWNVYTLEPQLDQLFMVKHHSVEVIHTEQDKAYIRGDLPATQQILAAGLHRIVPGQVVRVEQQHSINTGN
ncbi:efflux RND transporter periplasmic adaptor subunit [Thalassotalea sp. Y01]|uniref:efflux RND transporter periplasmic adaptor subunit n=1 Tax=Thalassotalea sp. Y01 TaxID=2729613 RepID=UPI00145E50B8|nr:efflux RND transporter periplasmic adaptor subunit [Thalassotalea sp. Y01]NMP17804.1 efflux RND transporter periplasmic adaptor subunit [Thalassotalea sp. Y01]